MKRGGMICDFKSWVVEIMIETTANVLTETVPERRMWLSPARTALYIETFFGVPSTPSSLAKLRCRGDGPPYYLFGNHPVYDPADIDAWAESKLGPKVHSTAGYAPNDPAWIRRHRAGRRRSV